MPPSNPSLIKIVTEGGVLMGPFLLLVVAWLFCTLRYILGSHRGLKALVGLLIFPVAFGLLAVAHGLLYSNSHFVALELAGYPDVVQHAQSGLAVTRSGLVVVATGAVSLVTCGLLFALPSKNPKNESPLRQ